MANKFDNHVILRIILIVLAMFVLFALINYYNSKQTTNKALTERFYEQLQQPPVQSKPVQSVYPPQPSDVSENPLLINDVAQQQTNAVKPGEEHTNSDYRAVDFNSEKLPSDCFPRDRLTAEDLLPSDAAANSKWAQVNPAGQGDVSNQNFLTAGWNVGINTVSGSLRNANLQLRSEPPNPRGAWPIMNSTIQPDLLRRPLELGPE